MTGIIVIIMYAVIMLGATLIFTQKAKNTVSFHVADRNIGGLVGAMSIAATWIWAPSLFVSAEKAYTNGIPGILLVSRTECAVFNYFHSICKTHQGEIPRGDHVNRLYG